jgi:hypothetical protein
MAVYQSGKKWRVDVYFQDTKVLSQGKFLTKDEAQKWHDEQKLAWQDNPAKQVESPQPRRVRQAPPPVDSKTVREIQTPVSAPPIFQDRKQQPKDRSTKSFQDLWERFEAVHLPILRKSTQTRYAVDVKYRILPFFEAYTLNQVDQMVFEDFKIWLLQRLSPKSANNCLALAKTILKKGVEWGMLKANPAKNVRMQKISDKKYTW